MDQNLRASIQSSTFYYFTIVLTLTTISQLTTMSVIVFADIAGKENVVAAVSYTHLTLPTIYSV